MTVPFSFNVTDSSNTFGVADPSGMQDSTNAFKGALLAAASAVAVGVVGGAQVLVPKGRYKISGRLTIPDRVALIGPGGQESATLDFATSVEDTGIELGSTFGLAMLKGIAIDNVKGVGVRVGRRSQGHRNFCEVSDVLVRNSLTDGFKCENTYMTTFERCCARDCNGNGFSFNGFNTSLNVNTCWSHSSNDNGFLINSTVYSNFTNCGADGSENHGYKIMNSQAITLSSCAAEQTKKSSIFIVATPSYANTEPFPNGMRHTAQAGVMGITISSFYSLFGNSSGSAWPSYLYMYTEGDLPIIGSSLNHFSLNPGGSLEVKRDGYNSVSKINFLITRGADTIPL